MDFAYSEKVNRLRQQINDFMERYIYPNEQTYHQQIAASGNPHHHAEIVDELKAGPEKRVSGTSFCPIKSTAQDSPTLNTLPWPRSWVALPGPQKSLTAPHRIPAIWKSWPSLARRNRKNSGFCPCSMVRPARPSP